MKVEIKASCAHAAMPAYGQIKTVWQHFHKTLYFPRPKEWNTLVWKFVCKECYKEFKGEKSR